MLTATLLVFALGAGEPAGRDKPAPRLELFGKEDWYKSQKGKEQAFIGVLKKVDRGGDVGIGRFNPYRLEMAKETREVHVGGAPKMLAPYVGMKVKVVGKPVEIEVVGRIHKEIWPARLEVIGAGGEAGGKKFKRPPIGKLPPVRGLPRKKDRPLDKPIQSDLKVHAQAKGERLARASKVIRSAEELAKAQGAKDPDKAAADLARRLKVPAIDWKKQMVVFIAGGTRPTGGYSVDIRGLTVKDKQLTVHWKLNSPPPGAFVTQAITHPSLVALVDRFDGMVRFDPATPKGGLEVDR